MVKKANIMGSKANSILNQGNIHFKILPLKLGLCGLILAGTLATIAQPANDNFANRVTIPWVTNVVVFTIIGWENGGPVANSVTSVNSGFAASGCLSNATSELGEPFITGVSGGQTAWWTWTAPSNGIVTLSASGTEFSPLLSVYTGNDLPGLSLVVSNTYLACYEHVQCGCYWRVRNQITFHAARGQAYQIAADSPIVVDASYQMINRFVTNADGSIYWVNWWPVATTNIFPGGSLQLGLQFTPAPTNDDFENRVKISGARTHIAASNAGATRQTGEPNHLGNSGGSSVWYSWTASASGRVALSTNNIPPYLPPSSSGDGYGVIVITGPTCGNEIDQNPPPPFYPVFAAYTGTNLSSLVLASNCLPMNLEAYPNAVEFDAIKGQTYQLAFDGNLGTTGTIPLFLALTQPASNDNFKHRIELHGINVAATGFNAGATREAGEPYVAGSTGKSVWWSWTAPVGGTVSIDLGGSDHSFPVGVFVGTSVANLNLIAAGSGSVSFGAVQGQTYQLAVNDASGLTGAIRLKLQAPVVGLPLARTLVRSGNVALLSFMAAPRQVILLQSSNDGSTWKDVRTTISRQTTVNFLARPAPTDNGPYYRAIVVDYQ